MTEKQFANMQQQFHKEYLKAMQELETYCQYSLRCLHRIGIHPAPSDFTIVAYPRPNNTIGEVLIYPASAVTDKGITNPMFSYGFYFEYDFKDLEHPYKTIFNDALEELLQ